MGIFIGIKALSWWSWCPDYPALTEVINSILATRHSTEGREIRRKMLILALTERTHFKNAGHRNLNITCIKSLSHRTEGVLEMGYSMQVRNGSSHAGHHNHLSFPCFLIFMESKPSCKPDRFRAQAGKDTRSRDVATQKLLK